MVKAIILDCFGVLYIPIGEDFYSTHIPDYKKHHAELHALGYKVDIGEITQEQLIQKVAQIGRLNADEVRKGIVGQYVRNNTLLNFCQSLRPGVKLGFLSNISKQAFENFFSQKEREQLFDAVVVSGEVGLAKPDPKIFELIEDQLGVPPQDCLMIDDNPMHCSGAIESGMKAVVYQNTAQVITKLKEL